MKGRFTLVLIAVLGLCAGNAVAEMFTITIENIGVQPITPAFVATHGTLFDMFDEGAAASAELVAIAEGGDTGPMVTLAGGSADVLDFGVGDFLAPGESTSVTVMADMDHPYLSLAAMLAMTNDGFIGLAYGDDALNLYRAGMPQSYDFTISYLDVWDAGSELNTELAADVPGLGGSGSPDENGVITRPHQGILGVGDVPMSFDFFGHDVARIMVVPEPAALSLLAVGALLVFRRR
ncbi:MAG: spondin domain-containing protein [Phycisphaerae bacterium]|jgi:hypothetical protein